MNYGNLTESSDAYPQPDLLNIELMEHQKRSLYAMHKLEKYGKIDIKNFLFYDNVKKDIQVDTRIGILGDKVGAGKSLIIVALCLITKAPPKKDLYYSSGKYMLIKSLTDNTKEININLLIVPNKLLTQWKEFFSFAPTIRIYITDTRESIEKINSFDDIDVCIISNTMVSEFMIRFPGICWGRIFIDEADTIKIENHDFMANFLWFVTGTTNGIAYSKKIYINKIFGQNKDWVTDAITVKNNKDYVESSLKLPVLKRILIECHTPPEINVLKDFIPNSVMQMINAGNSDDAIKALNCHVDTKDNIFQVINKKIINAINVKTKELEKEKSVIKNNRGFMGATKIKKLEKVIASLISRLKAIKNKIIDECEETCSICLGDLNKPTMLDCCGNVFCFECLTLVTGTKHKCPICQKIIDRKSFHVISKEQNINERKYEQRKKIDVLLEIIKQSKQSKILIFANYAETFSKIKCVLEQNTIAYKILKGNQKEIQNILDNFSKGNIQVIMLNAENFGAGMNLQMATDVIIYHRFTKEMEEQVVGRAQRLGRTTKLNVYYLMHDNEQHSFNDMDKAEEIDYDAYLEIMNDEFNDNDIKPNMKKNNRMNISKIL